MKKIKKYIMILFCIIVGTTGISMNVQADTATGKIEKIVDGSALSENNMSTVTLENYSKGNILNKGTDSIANNGNGTVNVYGAVFGSVVCDKMILELTLQRYSNGSWSTVKSFSATANSTSLLTKSYNVKVTKGYYYRVKAACVAQKNGVSESQIPITDGILIN